MKRVALIAFLVAAAAPAFAQQRGGGAGARPAQNEAWRGKAEIAGKIVDDTGAGMGDVRVTFVHVETNTGFFVASKKKTGEFAAKDMKPGEWRVQVDAPDFVTLRQTVQVTDKKNTPLALTMKRDNSPALLKKGDELYAAGKFGEARAEYAQVLQLHPELTAINRAIAFTYGREKNHAEALKYLDLALAGNPNDAQLLELAASSATEVGDYPRAVAYLEKVDEATLPNPDMMANAAYALMRKGQIAAGIALMDKMIARFPNAADPYMYRAIGNLQTKNTAAAKPDLEKFIALAPPDSPMLPQAKEWLGQIKED